MNLKLVKVLVFSIGFPTQRHKDMTSRRDMLHGFSIPSAKVQQFFDIRKKNALKKRIFSYFLWAARASWAELKMFCQMIYAAAPSEDKGLR